jgi:rubredoxin
MKEAVADGGSESTPKTKTCPDCAEEGRFAARKCRFCGYLYEEASFLEQTQ